MGRVAAAVALGSNLGDRRAHLAWAFDRLATLLDRAVCSSIIETEPVGVGAQPPFLNACAVGGFDGTARDLLGRLLELERARGRERPFPGAARTLDLDLVLFGDLVIEEAGLVVPHPRFRERALVLAPLAEVAPGMIDPVTGDSVADLARRLGLMI